MIPADALARLATLGLTAEQAEGVAGMLRAVEEATRAEAEAPIVARREKDRIRKAASRPRNSADIRGQDWNSAPSADAKAQSIESRDAHVEDNLLPLETSGKKEGRKRESARGARLPPDFHPDIDEALAEGISRPIAEREARKFVDHFLSAPGEKGRKQNWPATWRNWCRRVADGGPYQSQAPPQNGHSRKLSTAEQAIHELNKYRDHPEQPSFQSEADFGTGTTIETGDFRRIG